jgi:invasion protein IalB
MNFTMRQVWLVLGAVVLMAAAGVILLWPQASEDQPSMASFGFEDWSVRCDVVQARAACGLTQQVADARLGRPVLQLTFVSTTSGAVKLAAVVPLGISVPDGATLQVGDLTRRIDYAQCLAAGCIALLDVDDELVGKMKQGGEARLGVVNRTGAPIAVPVSLKGFAGGYETMRAKGGMGGDGPWWLAWVGQPGAK